jgi:hypothetical protein
MSLMVLSFRLPVSVYIEGRRVHIFKTYFCKNCFRHWPLFHVYVSLLICSIGFLNEISVCVPWILHQNAGHSHNTKQLLSSKIPQSLYILGQKQFKFHSQNWEQIKFRKWLLAWTSKSTNVKLKMWKIIILTVLLYEYVNILSLRWKYILTAFDGRGQGKY